MIDVQYITIELNGLTLEEWYDDRPDGDDLLAEIRDLWDYTHNYQFGHNVIDWDSLNIMIEENLVSIV